MNNLDTPFKAGDRVQLVAVPPYLKTAESIPMLRPADRVQLGEQGTILGRAPGASWRVRFEQGAYLLDEQYLQLTMKS